MEAVGLIFPERAPTLMEVAKVLSERFTVDLQEGFIWADQIALHNEIDSGFIRRNTFAELMREHYFDDWPLELIPESAEALGIDYHSVAFVKEIVKTLATSYRFWIDTDFGPIYSIEGFAQRCARDPGWDWVRESHGVGPIVFDPVE